MGRQAEAESGPRRLEAESSDTPATATLEVAVPRGSHRIDGGLRASRGASRRQQWRRRQERVGGRARRGNGSNRWL